MFSTPLAKKVDLKDKCITGSVDFMLSSDDCTHLIHISVFRPRYRIEISRIALSVPEHGCCLAAYLYLHVLIKRKLFTKLNSASKKNPDPLLHRTVFLKVLDNCALLSNFFLKREL